MRNHSENNECLRLTVAKRGSTSAKMAVTSNKDKVRRLTGRVEEALSALSYWRATWLTANAISGVEIDHLRVEEA